MSCNRENVIWQSADGRWNRGMYDFHIWGDDPEWDVEYDMGRFHWVSTGHETEQAAADSWDGANPGGATVVAHTDPTAAMCAEFDQMARNCDNDRPDPASSTFADALNPWPRTSRYG